MIFSIVVKNRKKELHQPHGSQLFIILQRFFFSSCWYMFIFSSLGERNLFLIAIIQQCPGMSGQGGDAYSFMNGSSTHVSQRESRAEMPVSCCRTGELGDLFISLRYYVLCQWLVLSIPPACLVARHPELRSWCVVSN